MKEFDRSKCFQDFLDELDKSHTSQKVAIEFNDSNDLVKQLGCVLCDCQWGLCSYTVTSEAFVKLAVACSSMFCVQVSHA